MSVDSYVPGAPHSRSEQIKSIISQISRIPLSDLDENVNVREELGIDSLMAMEIIATCEKRLGINIDERRYVEIETIGEFLHLVESLVRGKSED